MDYITKPFVIGALQRKIKAMFAMLEHHKPAKDIYDDGRLFLDFSEQTASLNGKPLTLSPMEYKMCTGTAQFLCLGIHHFHELVHTAAAHMLAHHLFHSRF